ncbi:hypothetical protein S420910_198 [Synechococcus phage S-CAM7]|uniref:Uncharacterized protein n=1 Tax=Synechococcus phage S-CAM7 TaxID=1883368 RepID=A0A1D8KUR0_9CAUD|nr:hypothetical protein S420910_198 [Synechococcus phage S-CAM7]
MIECFASTHGLFWILTGLLLISEALGETKLVKANGVLSFLFEILEQFSKIIRKIMFGR